MEFEIGDSPASMAPDVAAAADKGMEVLLLAGFDSRIPSASEAQNLGAWARTFGPGGTFWATRSDKALASRFIEFGNETSYSYQGTTTAAASTPCGSRTPTTPSRPRTPASACWPRPTTPTAAAPTG